MSSQLFNHAEPENGFLAGVMKDVEADQAGVEFTLVIYIRHVKRCPTCLTLTGIVIHRTTVDDPHFNFCEVYALLCFGDVCVLEGELGSCAFAVGALSTAIAAGGRLVAFSRKPVNSRI